MEQSDLKDILNKVSHGELSVDDAVLKIKRAPFEDLGFAKIDHHRAVRQGAAEVIYGAGKTAEQIIKIAETMLKNGQKTVLITRVDMDKADALKKTLPLTYFAEARIAVAGEMPKPQTESKIVVARWL